MRIIIICSLFFLACNSGSKKPAIEKEKENTSNVSNEQNADQQKAEVNIREYVANRSKGKTGDFIFGKLEKNTGDYADEVFLIKCSFREIFDDGGDPMDRKETYFLDKDLKVVRVDYN